MPARVPEDTFTPSRPAVRLYFAGARRKIMTYNVMNLNKGRMDRGQWDGLNELAQVIRQEDPDVIALQEVESRDVLSRFNRQYLNSAYRYIVFPSQQPDSNHRLAFLSKENIRVISEKSHLGEQNRGKFHGKRDFLEATFETETGYRFTLFNAHFKSTKIDRNLSSKPPTPSRQQEITRRLARYENIRREEAGNAARILRTFLAQKPEERMLVVGDLNSRRGTPHGDEIRKILATPGDGGRDQTLVPLLDENDPDTTRTGLVDGVFASKAMAADVKRTYVAGDLYAEPWLSASNHLPIVTEIEEPDELPSVAAQKPAIVPATRPRLELTA